MGNLRHLGLKRTVRRPSFSDRRSFPMPALPRFLTRRLARRIADEDASRPMWRHPATIAAAALALTLGAVPLLPDGGDDEQGAIAPTAETTDAPGAAGRGEVTRAMRAEIDRVLA